MILGVYESFITELQKKIRLNLACAGPLVVKVRSLDVGLGFFSMMEWIPVFF